MQSLQKNTYDLVVIGAGIQGVGIAEYAAKRGSSVLIVERNASVGMETSSNSSKLIHGGLRYLETFQFSLVYECLAQRKWLLKEKPDLVTLKPFYIPIYQTSSRQSWWVFLGLSLYSILGGLKKENRFHFVPQKKWPQLGIKTQGLKCVFQYFDAQTHDQKLTQSVSQSALRFGADLACGSALVAAKLNNGLYELTLSDGREVQCTTLVNAAGPWVNEVAGCIQGAPSSQFDWVQGTHLVLDIPEFDMGGQGACFYLESTVDGRAFFVLPWSGKVMVGTTELVLSSPHAKATDKEVDYLLTSFNDAFPDYHCTPDQIHKTYCGIRVLPSGKVGVSPSHKSRETLFVQSGFGTAKYLAVYGGKLTSYRATAQKVCETLNLG